MCGIAGFFGSADNAIEMEDHVSRMTDSLAHRGPDDQGVWVDPEAGVAFGHRRLSILDLSQEGHQPMFSACGRFVIVYNGEVYNFTSLRQDLEAAGHSFKGHSDTEVVLASIRHWGLLNAVKKFVGMFAFALWDRQEHTLYLVRDRLGIKPLYYGRMGNRIAFASELKAFHRHPSFKPEIDRDALALYVRYGYIPNPFSVYKGIRKLVPGTILRIDDKFEESSGNTVKYWSAIDAAEHGLSNPWDGTPEEAIDRLDALLREAIRIRMVADVPLGAFLSGGVDSSTVVALMQAQSDQPVRTFTIGFHERGYNEARYAREVARHLGTEHTELYVTPRHALELVPRLPILYDEPFSDSSQLPTFLVSEMTRQHVTVSLSGDGGDELFAGYGRYLTVADMWRRISGVPRSLRTALSTLVKAVPTSLFELFALPFRGRLPDALEKNTGHRIKKAAVLLKSDSPERLYQALVSTNVSPGSLVLGGEEPAPLFTRWERRPQAWDVIHSFMAIDLLSYLPDDILLKLDRASMGVSLEARVPMLDHRVVEFAWTLPIDLKIRGGTGKWVLQQVLERYVPNELVRRPKMGFGVPIGEWLRRELRDWAESLLDLKRLREDGYFDPETIRSKWDDHLSGKYNCEFFLWNVLMFQAWKDAYDR